MLKLFLKNLIQFIRSREVCSSGWVTVKEEANAKGMGGAVLQERTVSAIETNWVT